MISLRDRVKDMGEKMITCPDESDAALDYVALAWQEMLSGVGRESSRNETARCCTCYSATRNIPVLSAEANYCPRTWLFYCPM